MAIFDVNQSYPKARNVQYKMFSYARTDSATAKCVLPKGAIVTNVFIHQSNVAVTGAASLNIGWAGATQALLNTFTITTTTPGVFGAGATAGTFLRDLTPLDQDRVITATFGVGTSTAGGTGNVRIEYFMPGPGEDISG